MNFTPKCVNNAVSMELEQAAKDYLLRGDRTAIVRFAEILQAAARLGPAFSTDIMKRSLARNHDIFVSFAEYHGGTILFAPVKNELYEDSIDNFICGYVENGQAVIAAA